MLLPTVSSLSLVLFIDTSYLSLLIFLFLSDGDFHRKHRKKQMSASQETPAAAATTQESFQSISEVR